MSIYLLCKGRFSCDGQGQEDQSQGLSLAVFSPAGTLVSVCGFSRFLSRNELSLHMHS